MEVTLQKEAPGPGIFVWWARALEGEEAIDTERLEGRRRGGQAKAMQAAWSEAQVRFRERAATELEAFK